MDRGTVSTQQFRVSNDSVRMISFTLMDRVEGPFSFEIDYIGFYRDPINQEDFAYEQYDRSGIVWCGLQQAFMQSRGGGSVERVL